MRPLLELKTIKNVSLREADRLAEAAARMGCGGLVLARDGGWDTVRGFCRSAARRSLELWLRDDPCRPSGGFGGEVTSVPEYRPEMPKLWGCSLYSAEAAEAFMYSSYVELRRELKGFFGYGLTGVVTCLGSGVPESPGDFVETQLRPLSVFCRENGLRLMAQGGEGLADDLAETGTAFVDGEGLTMAGRQRLLLPLAAGGKRRLAIGGGLYPDQVEEDWISAAGRLLSLTGQPPQSVEMELPRGMEAVGLGENVLIYNTLAGPVTGLADMEALNVRRVADLDGGLYLPLEGKLSFTLYEGGCLVLSRSAAPEADPLPAVLRSGAVFGEPGEGDGLPFELAGFDENRLPLDLEGGLANFEVRHIAPDSGVRIEAENASYIALNGLELNGANVSGQSGPVVVGANELRLGKNTLETDGTEAVLYGGFSTDGVNIIPPLKPGSGDVRCQGLARYDGPLVYHAVLPEDCGGKFLLPEGSFGCAILKIGRRRQQLLLPPFAAPLFASDGGRTAELMIFPISDRKDVPFGIDKLKIADIKN